MARMMVYLDEDDHKVLRRIAYEQQIPIAEQIRRAVKAYLHKASKSKGTGKRKKQA